MGVAIAAYFITGHEQIQLNCFLNRVCYFLFLLVNSLLLNDLTIQIYLHCSWYCVVLPVYAYIIIVQITVSGPLGSVSSFSGILKIKFCLSQC